VQHGILNYDNKPSKVWYISTEVTSKWLATVESNTFCTFGDVGKIRVGVKTTADKVFIRSDWDAVSQEERPELLKPLTTHHIARRFKAIQPEKLREILYTHKVVNGKRIAVNLDEFPRSAKYLNRYRSVLEKREYVLNARRKWYEIWVPQNPEVWAHPKIVFRDIAKKPTFWMDLSGSIVNGDCYWLVCKNPDQTDLLWLALAVGNSSFIETFYDYRFNNKLYAGRRRFMTQYVENFPLPDPSSEISKQIIQITKKLYNIIDFSPEANNLEKSLDRLVWEVFGLHISSCTTFDRVRSGKPCNEMPSSPSFNILSSTGVGIHKSGSPISMDCKWISHSLRYYENIFGIDRSQYSSLISFFVKRSGTEIFKASAKASSVLKVTLGSARSTEPM
jgi:hypothetical protein